MSKAPTLAQVIATKKAVTAAEIEKKKAELLAQNKAAAREQLLAISLILNRSRPIK